MRNGFRIPESLEKSKGTLPTESAESSNTNTACMHCSQIDFSLHSHFFGDYSSLYLDYCIDCIDGACPRNSFIEVWTDRQKIGGSSFFTCTTIWPCAHSRVSSVIAIECHGSIIYSSRVAGTSIEYHSPFSHALIIVLPVSTPSASSASHGFFRFVVVA